MKKSLFRFILTIFIFFGILEGAFSNSVEYVHKDISLQNVSSPHIEWQKLHEEIYNGLDNGIYWFKIGLDPSASSSIISIPEAHITDVQLYINDTEISRIEGSRYITYEINASESKSILYMRVNCLLEGRIPIDIYESEQFHKKEYGDYLIIGVYIGIVLAIVIFNLFSFYSFGNNTYIFYLFMVISLSLNALYKDGLIGLIFNSFEINYRIEPFINLSVSTAAIFFTTSYLGFEQELKKLKKIGIIFVLITGISVLFFQFYGGIVSFTVTAILNLISTTIFYFASIVLWKKSSYARFFAIAYGPLLLVAYDFYLSPNFGVRLLDPPLVLYKIGSAVEMIIFTFAIMYQAKQVNSENKEIREKLIQYTKDLKAENKGINESATTIDELVETYSLTLKEIEILKTLADNKTNKEIAALHFISENTVKYHIRNILKKLEVSSKQDAKERYLKKI